MQDIIIFDLDGTLANNDHRVHHIAKPPQDWRSFFAKCGMDTPIEHMIKILKMLAFDGSCEIWIVSGRSDEVRAETEEWIKHHLGVPDKLIMRKSGDHTDDAVLKISWLKDGTIPKERVLCVFDDRKRVVDAWRAEGVPCYQVAPGEF